MADKQHFEAIVGDIGRKLWSIFPADAVEMRFEAQFHEWMQTAGVSQWTRRDGVQGQHAGFGSRPEEVEESIKVDLARMRTLDIFLPRPWNHVTVTLTETAKINFDYAYVDEIDQWPRLQRPADRHWLPVDDEISTVAAVPAADLGRRSADAGALRAIGKFTADIGFGRFWRRPDVLLPVPSDRPAPSLPHGIGLVGTDRRRCLHGRQLRLGARVVRRPDHTALLADSLVFEIEATSSRYRVAALFLNASACRLKEGARLTQRA